MNRSEIETLLARKSGVVKEAKSSIQELDEDGEKYVQPGLDGIMAASEKLLAVNRGLIPTDDRDSLQFKRVYDVPKLFRERVKLDAGKLRNKFMRVLSKRKSLKSLPPFAFDEYMNGQILKNPLSSPLEEINPLQLMEQSRRMTLMGPGGIGSENAITEDMQSIHPSQFGFMSTLEGPECFDDKSEVYTIRGWVPWPEIKDDDVFACRINGVLEWHKSSRIVREDYEGRMLCAESSTLRLCVTPNHRILYHWGDGVLKEDVAEDIYGRSIKIPIRHSPQLGREDWDTFILPDIPKGGNAQKTFKGFDIGDWCEYVGWFLSEGNIHDGMINITQCPEASPENHEILVDLHRRMGLVGERFTGTIRKFSSGAKQLLNYFEPYKGRGCYDKWIPEELFYAPVEARQRMLEALLRGDGRWNDKRMCYCSVSERLAKSVERLAISLGYTAFIRIEKDSRDHVKTTNYVVSLHRQFSRQPAPDQWYIKENYRGKVYCATVPGGLLHVRGSSKNSGFWTGNSEKIGVDTRAAWGAKMGSDGKLYQRFRDRRTGKIKWMSPEDLDGMVVKLPD